MRTHSPFTATAFRSAALKRGEWPPRTLTESTEATRIAPRRWQARRVWAPTPESGR
jgi:hypothetical protein